MTDATRLAIKATLGMIWFGFWFFFFFPWLVLTLSGDTASLAWKPRTLLGVGLVAAGLAVIVRVTSDFVRRGGGTPVPIAPPRVFVSTGLFRWLRNPMYLADIAVLSGIALVVGAESVAWYAFGFAAVVHVYVTRVEEAGLRKRFGASYRDYCDHVSRWVPRPPR